LHRLPTPDGASAKALVTVITTPQPDPVGYAIARRQPDGVVIVHADDGSTRRHDR
jgi:hypothetical protein